MTDIAAFFAPTALPAVAGAVASAPKAGDVTIEFANLLAELQGAAGPQIVQPNALLALNAPAIAQVTPIKGLDLGSNADAQATLETLLANGADARAVNPDATLVAQLAALQNALQALQTEAQAAPSGAQTAVQTNKLGLRGTIAPVALDAQLPKTEATAIAQAKPAETAVPPELLAALNNQKPAQQHHSKLAAKAPSTTQTPVDGAVSAQSAATTRAALPTENSNGGNAFGSNANPNAQGLAQQPAHANTAAPTANPQAFAAAVNAAQTSTVDTPAVTLSATPPARFLP